MTMLSKKQVKEMLDFISENKDNKYAAHQVFYMQDRLSDFRSEYITKLRELILENYPATNAKEYEFLGRAIQGCNQISILEDGSVYNGYNYGKKNTNATWRASGLIDDAIKILEENRNG